MSRELKEKQMCDIYRTLGNADKIICAHSAATYGIQSRGMEDFVPQLSPEDFEQYYSDFMYNWGDTDATQQTKRETP